MAREHMGTSEVTSTYLVWLTGAITRKSVHHKVNTLHIEHSAERGVFNLFIVYTQEVTISLIKFGGMHMMLDENYFCLYYAIMIEKIKSIKMILAQNLCKNSKIFSTFLCVCVKNLILLPPR